MIVIVNVLSVYTPLSFMIMERSADRLGSWLGWNGRLIGSATGSAGTVG
ncbi:hypothetical protein ABN028_08310 [Actinopolymorpha sp. B17G11]